MKKQKRNIEEEIQKTMASLDQHKRLEGNPFLYTRIKQRMSDGGVSKKAGSFLPSLIQPVLFVGLLLINVYTIYPLLTNTSSDEEYLQAIAEEYNLEVIELTNLYNFE